MGNFDRKKSALISKVAFFLSGKMFFSLLTNSIACISPSTKPKFSCNLNPFLVLKEQESKGVHNNSVFQCLSSALSILNQQQSYLVEVDTVDTKELTSPSQIAIISSSTLATETFLCQCELTVRFATLRE